VSSSSDNESISDSSSAAENENYSPKNGSARMMNTQEYFDMTNPSTQRVANQQVYTHTPQELRGSLGGSEGFKITKNNWPQGQDPENMVNQNGYIQGQNPQGNHPRRLDFRQKPAQRINQVNPLAAQPRFADNHQPVQQGHNMVSSGNQLKNMRLQSPGDTNNFSSTMSPQFNKDAYEAMNQSNKLHTQSEHCPLREFSLSGAQNAGTMEEPSGMKDSGTYSMAELVSQAQKSGQKYFEDHGSNVFKEKDGEKGELVRRLQEVEQKFREAIEENQKLMEDNEKVNKELETMKMNHQEYLGRLEMTEKERLNQVTCHYEARLVELKNEMRTLQEKVDEQKKKKNKERKKRKKMKTENMAILGQKEQTINQLTHELGSLKYTVELLNQELEGFKQNNQIDVQNGQMLEEAKNKIRSLEKKNKRLKKEIKAYKKMQAENEELESSKLAFEELKMKVVTLVKENSRLNAMLNTNQQPYPTGYN
jgi:hypothetical protein